ncbi:MAG: phosphoribosylamine--glycine ligase, partial [Gammaproteobacteria bacterium]
MKVLIVGGGGREHALAWKAAQSKQVDRVFVAPGNPGTSSEDKVSNVTINAEDIQALKAFAEKEKIDLTIVGPENPLVDGIVDEFKQAGLACFGPSKDAAILEGSKSFSKEFLQRHNIPTAEYQVFTEVNAAKAYIKEKGTPIVVKADGLAAGKGVIIASSEDEANVAIDDMLA